MDQPKRKYVCTDCDEFSTDDSASLNVHYNFEHELIVEFSYLEPEVILEELDGKHKEAFSTLVECLQMTHLHFTNFLEKVTV